MIWTVILKNGESFVIHGASFDRNTEVRKCLKARRLSDTSVAGIVQGNHPVEKFHAKPQEFSKQLKAALVAPEFDDFDIADKVMEVVFSSKEDKSPVDEEGRPFNAPAKW